MKNKKILAALLTLGLASGVVACGNGANTNSANDVKMAEPTTEDVKNEDVAVEPEPANEVSAEKGIYDLEFGYLPEGYVENFKDEKNDLRTVEYGAEKNPASKVTLQISDNDERFAELVTVPEDAESVTIGANEGKYWNDGSFDYLVIKDGANNIYARSTIGKDETIKVVEAIK